jgi:hypothetical protein
MDLKFAVDDTLLDILGQTTSAAWIYMKVS